MEHELAFLSGSFLRCISWIYYPDSDLLLACIRLIQVSSVAQLCLTFCDPMDCSMPGFPVYHPHPRLLRGKMTHPRSCDRKWFKQDPDPRLSETPKPLHWTPRLSRHDGQLPFPSLCQCSRLPPSLVTGSWPMDTRQSVTPGSYF